MTQLTALAIIRCDAAHRLRVVRRGWGNLRHDNTRVTCLKSFDMVIYVHNSLEPQQLARWDACSKSTTFKMLSFRDVKLIVGKHLFFV